MCCLHIYLALLIAHSKIILYKSKEKSLQDKEKSLQSAYTQTNEDKKMTIKQLEAKLLNAKTARERAEINAAIAFIRGNKRKPAAESTSIAACAKRSGMSVEEYRSFHGC